MCLYAENVLKREGSKVSSGWTFAELIFLPRVLSIFASWYISLCEHQFRTFVSDISSTQYSQSVRLMNIRMSWQDRCKEGRNTTHNVSFDDYVSQERDWRATLPLPLTSMSKYPKNTWSKADECKNSRTLFVWMDVHNNICPNFYRSSQVDRWIDG